MNKIDKVKAKIEQIERLLSEVKSELGAFSESEQTSSKKTSSSSSVPIPSEHELQAEFEKLYEEFKIKNLEAIKSFIKEKDKNYLKLFCKANSLPLDTTKISKDAIAEEAMKWMAQREAITRKAT